jgi:nucleoside-diphosphate-sugar epimerase
MRALVTGAGGFIGSNLCSTLAAKGYRVRGLLLPGECADRKELRGVEVRRGDIIVPSTLKGCASGCDLIFHCAARVSDWGPKHLFAETIVGGTRNMLEECHGKTVRFIYVSSTTAYGLKRNQDESKEGQPLVKVGVPYSDCKVDAEHLCREFMNKTGMDIVIVRPSHVEGPGSTIVKEVIEAFKRGPLPLIDHGRADLGLVYVDNLVNGMILAAEKGESGNAYHFCDDGRMTWKEFLTLLGGLVGKRPAGSIPFRLAWHMGGCLEKAYRPFGTRPPFTRASAGMFGRSFHVDCSWTKKQLGWNPHVPFEEALDSIVHWVQNSYLPSLT